MINKIWMPLVLVLAMVGLTAQETSQEAPKEATKALTGTLDPVHSTVIFRIKHLGASYTWGRLNDIAGTFMLDAANPANSSCDISVQAATVDTNNEKRDTHLMGPDFLDAKQFPTITLKGKGAKAKDPNTWELSGELTLHGITKPVTLIVERTGQGKHPQTGDQLEGYECRFTIKRSDYGITYGIPNVGDEVDLFIAIEAVVK